MALSATIATAPSTSTRDETTPSSQPGTSACVQFLRGVAATSAAAASAHGSVRRPVAMAAEAWAGAGMDAPGAGFG